MTQERIEGRRYEYFKSVGKEMNMWFGWFGPSVSNDLCLYRYGKDHTIYYGYFGSVRPIFKTDTDVKPFGYAYKDNTYLSIAEVIKVIDKDNESKPYPLYTYDVTWRPSARVITRIDWYMKDVLKFQNDYERGGYSGYSRYCQKNMFGEKIHTISVHIKNEFDENVQNEEDVEGTILHIISWGTWVSIDFKGIDDFVSKVNGLIEPNMLYETATNMETIGNMDDNKKDYDFQLAKVDDSLNCYKVQCLQATKKALEDALKKINEQLDKQNGKIF